MNDGMLRSAAALGKSNSGFSSQSSLAQVQTTGRRDLPGDVANDAIACCQTVTMSQSVPVVIRGCHRQPASVNSSIATGISCQSITLAGTPARLRQFHALTTFPSDSLPYSGLSERLIPHDLVTHRKTDCGFRRHTAFGGQYLLCGSVTLVPSPTRVPENRPVGSGQLSI